MVAVQKPIEEQSVRQKAQKIAVHQFTKHPERYREVLEVFRKYELYQVINKIRQALGQPEDDDYGQPTVLSVEDYRHAENLARALEELGPCFIKLGQLLSTRPDVLPGEYIEALARLQSRVSPVPSATIAQIIEHELGAPLEELFGSFDEQPLAAASMAQVHRATLPDGTPVAVKVQRPRIRQRIETDLEVMREVAQLATRFTPFGKLFGLLQMVRELETSLGQELDFLQEADHTRLIGRLLSDFKTLATPTVYPEYTTQRVLTLSFVEGRPLAAVPTAEMSRLPTPTIARDLLSAYLKQIIVDGIFHCDPHPGNILLANSGRLTMLDFGMVGRLDAGQKDQFILLLLAFSERQGDRVAELYLEMEPVPQQFDRWAFTQDVSALVSRYHDMSGGRMALGTALLDLTKLANRHRAPVPAALTLLGKTMLNLDGTIRVLSPELDPVQLIRDYMRDVMQQRLKSQLSPGRTFAWVLDTKHLIENAPRRTDAILNKLANDQLTFRLSVDQQTTKTLDRVSSRLARSLVLSALLIGGGNVLNAYLQRKKT